MPNFKKPTSSKQLNIQIDQTTNTQRDVMNDILRVDLVSEIKEFSDHIQDKIERLDERMRFVNYKFEDVRFWFKRYSISIIYLATLLTLIEALMNSLDIESIPNSIARHFFKFSPLLLSSLVSLIAALIKFNKYEDKIEDITRASEKCIITIAKLKEVKEELYFCKTVESFIKINDRFTRDIYTEYLDSNTNIERQLLDTDYAKYMKKVANNDVKRAEILVNRNKELDNIGRNSGWFLETYISKLLRKKSNSAVSYPIDEEEAKLSEIQRKFVPHKKTCSLTAEHNKKDRPIPYRGGSPPPIRQLNYETRRQNIKYENSLVKERQCIKCYKIYVSDVNRMRTGCPYCNLHNQIISPIAILGNDIILKNNADSCAKAAIDIQKRWRKHITRKGRLSD
jgi:hypothetical protein